MQAAVVPKVDRFHICKHALFLCRAQKRLQRFELVGLLFGNSRIAALRRVQKQAADHPGAVFRQRFRLFKELSVHAHQPCAVLTGHSRRGRAFIHLDEQRVGKLPVDGGTFHVGKLLEYLLRVGVFIHQIKVIAHLQS